MEKLKEKHNHALTKILKVLTFAIVLLFPFLVFMPSALYYGFNEHAQIEIPQKVAKYQTNEINNFNDFVEGNIYHFDIFNMESGYDFDFTINVIQGTITDYVLDNAIYLTDNIYSYNANDDNYLKIRANYEYLEIYFSKGDLYYAIESSGGGIYFEDVDIQIIDLVGLNTYFNEAYGMEEFTITPSEFNVYEITETTSISENLSNSWENMWQTPLFAWTDNTPFTSTTNAFASVFNISQQSGFYNLIAYFITITGIYLIIDIVLGVATMLTHMIGRQD